MEKRMLRKGPRFARSPRSVPAATAAWSARPNDLRGATDARTHTGFKALRSFVVLLRLRLLRQRGRGSQGSQRDSRDLRRGGGGRGEEGGGGGGRSAQVVVVPPQTSVQGGVQRGAGRDRRKDGDVRRFSLLSFVAPLFLSSLAHTRAGTDAHTGRVNGAVRTHTHAHSHTRTPTPTPTGQVRQSMAQQEEGREATPLDPGTSLSLVLCLFLTVSVCMCV